jgi:signal transduction histidine kinase
VHVSGDVNVLTIEISDDGVGGADASLGSGLTGLADRVGAAEGTLNVTSPVGRGTTLRATLPNANR